MVTFVVEDGTGKDDATSYTTEAFSDDYLGAAWAASSAEKEAALIAATEYIDLRYGDRFAGVPLDDDQALEFPREYLYDRYGQEVEGVPEDLQKATCLYAAQSDAGTLYPEQQASAKEVKSKTTKVGPVTTSVEYQGVASASMWVSFPRADKFVKQYTTGGGSGGRTIRA